MLQGAIFDVDGTILDSMPFWCGVGAEYLRSVGAEPEEDLTEKLFAMELSTTAVYLNEHYHLGRTEDEVLEGIAKIAMDFYEKRASFKAGILNIIEKFKEEGIPMSVATASDMRYMDRAFRRLDLYKYFKRVCSCVQLKTSKSEPFIFYKASEDFNCDRQNIYVFEDSLHSAMTAKAAGFKVAGVYDSVFDKHQEELKRIADVYITDFRDLDLSAL